MKKFRTAGWFLLAAILFMLLGALLGILLAFLAPEKTLEYTAPEGYILHYK